MYYLGVRPGDVHLNVSSPGWAKHAYSCVFAPWNAGATVFMLNQPRFNAKGLLDAIARCGITTFCAPPTVWRMLIQEDLAAWRVNLREALGAGEPLNPEVIERVRAAWGLTVRDGYGQTETTLQIGNFPGQQVKPGSMGQAAPGYRVKLLDPDGAEQPEGEVCLALDPPPLGLMQGYQGDEGAILPLDGAAYRTGDVAMRDADGYLTYVGRADDLFKASDYRISPFELESALDRAPGGGRSGGRPRPRQAAPRGPESLHRAGGEPSRPTAIPRSRSSAISARIWRPTSGCAGSNSPSCRKPSPARSAASSCALPKPPAPPVPLAPRANSARRIFPNWPDPSPRGSGDGRAALLRRLGAGDLHRIGAVAVAVGRGVDLFELDFAVQHLLFPGLLRRLVGVEFGHHLAGEQLEALADVLVGVLAGLVQEDAPGRYARSRTGAACAGSSRASRSARRTSARARPSGLARFHFSYSSHRLTSPGFGRSRVGLSP